METTVETEKEAEVYFVDAVDWAPEQSNTMMLLRMPASVAEELRDELKKIERIRHSPQARKAATGGLEARAAFFNTQMGQVIDGARRRIAELKNSVGYNYVYRSDPHASMLLYQAIPADRDPSWSPLRTTRALPLAAST